MNTKKLENSNNLPEYFLISTYLQSSEDIPSFLIQFEVNLIDQNRMFKNINKEGIKKKCTFDFEKKINKYKYRYYAPIRIIN